MSRAEARLAAQHSAIRRSLDDHAERVAKKARREQTTQQPPTAADRMAAIRARVSARATAAAARDGTAVAHSAAFAAHHGVASNLAD